LCIARSARPSWHPEHVVKLAEPSFDEQGFDPDRFDRRLESYRVALRTDRVEVVQWMARGTLDDADGRLDRLARDLDLIALTCTSARDSGALATVVGFAYDEREYETMLCAPWCDGLAMYFNAREPGPAGLIDACGRGGRGVVAIRPLAAGSIVSACAPETPVRSAVEAAIRFALSHSAVSTAVVSTSRADHLEALVEAAKSAERTDAPEVSTTV
jgi:aryl-alcohol dehydrogenase-like predicted oxidoreductase